VLVTKTTTNPGGRIPLLQPDHLDEDQRRLYDSLNSTAVPWAQASGFVAKSDDGGLIGPFNVALHSPVIGAAFDKLQSVEAENTTLNQRVRQVVILTVGAVWQSDYERYAHKAVARKAGLAEETVTALANGDEAPGLLEEEIVAQRFTRQLILHHHVDQDLFDRAKGCFGVRGIVDLLFLAGCYQTVCSLLNGFEVPVPGSQGLAA
jgi:4-carboxymuconolactone decarboxylase